MSKKITPKTTLLKILKIKEAAQVLEKYKVPCLFCPMAAMEMKNLKIGQVAEIYKLDLEGLIKEINEIYKFQKLSARKRRNFKYK